VAVAVGVGVGLGVAVSVGVGVCEFVAVGVAVAVDVGELVGWVGVGEAGKTVATGVTWLLATAPSRLK